jgi:DNA-binding transcriptional regulator YdaS (Cro superfamily)
MEPLELPPDLAALEERLQARPQPPLSPALRQRVLTTLVAHRAGRRSWKVFGAGLAAAALLGLNLTMTAVNSLGSRKLSAEDTADIAALTRQIQEIAPELSPREARGRALLYGSGRFGATALPGAARPLPHNE